MLNLLALVLTRLSQVIQCSSSYTIADEITIISQNAFQDCTDILTSFSFNANPKLQTIEDSAFSWCTKLTKIDLSKCKYLISIGNNAFLNCDSVRSLNLPSNLQRIGKGAFGSCSKIKSIDLSGITYLRIIDAKTFVSCQELIELKLPLNLEYIGFNALYNTKLQNFKIPKSVSDIAHFGIDNFQIDENNNFLKWSGNYLCNQDNTKILIYKGSEVNIIIPPNVKIIQDYCFYQNNYITSVTLPNQLQRIGEYAFQSCKHLARITIPATVTHIYEMAFSGCYNLETIVFESESKLEYIGLNAFKDTKINNLVLPKSLKNFSTLGIQSFTIDPDSENLKFDNYGILYGNNYKIAIFYKGSSDKITLNRNTKIIQDYCFKDCQTIHEFVSTGDLEYIGIEAFSNCTNLQSIKIESVDIIRDKALYGCKNLVSMNIKFKSVLNTEYPFHEYPKLASIGDFRYGDYRAINDTLIYYYDDHCTVMFHAAKSQHNLLRSRCEYIRNKAFDFSENLQTVIFKNILKISDAAFENCNNLKEIYVSDKLTYFNNLNYNFDKIYVLNNEQSVIDMLKRNGFSPEMISSWELPVVTHDFNVNMIKHLGVDFAGSIVRSNFLLLILSSLSSLF